MAKRYLFNVAEQANKILLMMSDHIGAIADYCDSYPIMRAIVENYLYGPPLMDRKDVLRMISDYGIPTDIAEDIMVEVQDEFIFNVRPTLGSNKGSTAFDFTLRNNGDLEIVVLDPPEPSPEEQYKNEIRQGLANGDYYPEHVRRLVEA